MNMTRVQNLTTVAKKLKMWADDIKFFPQFCEKIFPEDSLCNKKVEIAPRNFGPTTVHPVTTVPRTVQSVTQCLLTHAKQRTRKLDLYVIW